MFVKLISVPKTGSTVFVTDTWTPTWVNLNGFWLFQIPLVYFLAKYLKMGPMGVFIAIPVAETAITIASFILFKRGKWKKVKV